MISLLKFLSLGFFLWSCQSTPTSPINDRLTERDITFQKGLALVNQDHYAEAAPFFLKISQNSEGPDDETYSQSVWQLSQIYEEFGHYEKAVLALIELENRNAAKVSLLSVRFSLIKNYIRLGNRTKAAEIKNKLLFNDSIKSLYTSLDETTHFKYDHSMIEELQYLGEIQRYFIFVMESKQGPMNEAATSKLIYFYETFLHLLNKDSLNLVLKKTIAIELLEQLRKFELYKLNEINLNPNTIAKFSNFSAEKQKFITDWLHQ